MHVPVTAAVTGYTGLYGELLEECVEHIDRSVVVAVGTLDEHLSEAAFNSTESRQISFCDTLRPPQSVAEERLEIFQVGQFGVGEVGGRLGVGVEVHTPTVDNKRESHQWYRTPGFENGRGKRLTNDLPAETAG